MSKHSVPTVTVKARQGARPELNTYDVELLRRTGTTIVAAGVSERRAHTLAAELRGALADAYHAGTSAQ